MSITLLATELASQAGVFEPQRRNNWSLEIYGLSVIPQALGLPGLPFSPSALTLSLNTGFLPVETSEEQEIPYGNERVFYAGRGLFDAGTISVRDYIDRDTQRLIALWRSTVYNPVTGQVGLSSQYKKLGHIVVAAPDGSRERVWTLINLWPQAVNYGPLDMADSSQVIIELNLRYDKAIYTGMFRTS